MSAPLPQLMILTDTERILLLRRHKGLLQRVAERCRVNPSLVSRVFHGKARSSRVEKELARALSKIDVTAPRRAPTASPVDRSRELQWLADNRRQYAGQWVALDGYRLLAGGVDVKDVYEAARRSGVAHPLFHWVEPPDAPPFGGW